MRGRATRVVLSALACSGSSASSAIASTGSTPRGSDRCATAVGRRSSTRSSASGLVAVVAGGVLLLYGLMQRKAIAQEVASGRYRRTSALRLARLRRHVHRVLVLALYRLESSGRQQAVEEDAPVAAGPISPTTPEHEAITQYEPSVSWIPIAG